MFFIFDALLMNFSLESKYILPYSNLAGRTNTVILAPFRCCYLVTWNMRAISFNSMSGASIQVS